MKDWLFLATGVAVDVIDWLALIIIVVGAVELFSAVVDDVLVGRRPHERDAWLRLGRWLVAGLTFQLAADVLETAITTSWDEVGRLGAIAVIRTFLNYFLERDLVDIRTKQGPSNVDDWAPGGCEQTVRAPGLAVVLTLASAQP